MLRADKTGSAPSVCGVHSGRKEGKEALASCLLQNGSEIGELEMEEQCRSPTWFSSHCSYLNMNSFKDIT